MITWRKSSHSAYNGACVEVHPGPGVAVRDTTDRSGPVLVFEAGEWARFLAGLREGGER